MDQIRLNHAYTTRIESTPLTAARQPSASESDAQKPSFEAILQQQVEKQGQAGLNFSKHALKRISDRGVDMSPQLIGKLGQAVETAKDKGISNALVLGQQAAFIVNVPSRTIVTTMNQQDMQENVVTNIDGTVFL